MLDLLLIWLVTTVSLLIISSIKFFGVAIRDFRTAVIVALVLGLLNAIVRPILGFLSFPLIILSFGLFTLVINAAVFWLAAALIDGFTLRRGCLSALLGPIVLSLLNTVILAILR